jgi:hypothetical protein
MDSLTADEWFDEFQHGDIATYAQYRSRFTDEFFAATRSRFPLLIQQSGDFCRNVANNWLRLE